MFWYQCRYCKVNFDQWERLVTHRRDEHRQEFEALKRRSALLLRKQEEADTANKRLENSVSTNANIVVKSLSRSSHKMKQITPSTSAKVTGPPRRNHHSASKELDAKDLENREISLCIPSSSINLRSSSTSSTPFNRSLTPPSSLPTPTASPRVNGYTSPYSLNKVSCNGHNSYLTTSSSSFLTPPGTPSRQIPVPSSSPLLSAEELVLNLNMNWSPPADMRKAVCYHQMNDDDEIEISVIPSSGSCISVTNHSPPCYNTTPTRATRPPYQNGSCSSIVDQANSCSNGGDQQSHNIQQQQLSNSHVMIENLEDELRMPCSNDEQRSDTRREIGAPTSEQTRPAPLLGVRRKSHVEMLRSTGQGLKRLHSQLQQRQNHLRTRALFSPRLLSSCSSSATANPQSSRCSDNTDNIMSASRRLHNVRKANSANNGNKAGIQNRRLGRSSNGNSSTNVPRLITRASTRRPK